MSHLARAAIYLAILLSPIGAPLVGTLIGYCPSDPSIVSNGTFAMGMSYCGISGPIEHLYQHAVMLSFLPMVLAGPIVGGVVTVLWWVAALGSAAGCLWYLWRAAASVTIERI